MGHRMRLTSHVLQWIFLGRLFLYNRFPKHVLLAIFASYEDSLYLDDVEVAQPQRLLGLLRLLLKSLFLYDM